MTFELRLVATSEDWEAYHSIRERVLWEARGRFGSYDRFHADERKKGNFPCLLINGGGQPVGVVRIDVDPPLAWFRRVAIREDLQRQGYGRRMLEMAADFAKGRGCQCVRSNVDPEAVEFYRKLGFQIVVGEAGTSSVPMARSL
jgi:GNAT superfamily N-acetyltransferase